MDNFVVSANVETEKEIVEKTVREVFSATDLRDWKKLKSIFSDQLFVDYQSLSGEGPSMKNKQEIIDSWRSVIPGFYSTHHQVGNFNIEISGTKAQVNFRGLALHYLPVKAGKDHWVISGSYDFGLEKMKGRWLLTSIKFKLDKQSGNTELPMLAQKNIATNTINQQPKGPTLEAVNAVEDFFESLEAMDIKRFLEAWSDEAEQIMPMAPVGFPSLLKGKDAIYNQYKSLPNNFNYMKFSRRIFPTNDNKKVIVQYSGEIPLKDGGEYNNNYIALFELEGDKVKTFTEYFDPALLEQAFGQKLSQNFNVSTPVNRAEFKSEGVTMVGNIFLPKEFASSSRYPVVIVTGSWTTVKEQMANLYAKKMAEQGFVAFTFDFRHFGESGGEPRQYESPSEKSKDILNAVDFVATLPYIDKERIMGLSICASSGYMAAAAAQDTRIKAMALIAPWLHDATIAAQMYGGASGVAEKIQLSRKSEALFKDKGITEYIPAAEPESKIAAMPLPNAPHWDYYYRKDMGAIPEYKNQLAVMSWEPWLSFDGTASASKIKQPVLIVHSEAAAIPDGAKKFYSGLQGVKEQLWLPDVFQLDFYIEEEPVNASIKRANQFFRNVLKF